eukprot:3078675-Pyramimonas_sp.AAC.1
MSTALLIRSHYHSHNHDADAHIPRSTPPQRARAFVGLELLATCADLGFVLKDFLRYYIYAIKSLITTWT